MLEVSLHLDLQIQFHNPDSRQLSHQQSCRPHETEALAALRALWQMKCSRQLARNALAAFVSRGIGFSVLSEEFAERCIRRGELIDLNPGKALDYPVAIAWYPRLEMPK
jgi:DNA-binding transcriptional LysR family regulator